MAFAVVMPRGVVHMWPEGSYTGDAGSINTFIRGVPSHLPTATTPLNGWVDQAPLFPREQCILCFSTPK